MHRTKALQLEGEFRPFPEYVRGEKIEACGTARPFGVQPRQYWGIMHWRGAPSSPCKTTGPRHRDVIVRR
ncbi:MAG: hypothetical protein LC667_09660, partial [Thioalkalivibrio sp.]|nr:hypothetical protein [Thioalkalivibrio sp.]